MSSLPFLYTKNEGVILAERVTRQWMDAAAFSFR
ncbi:hypothetical protein JOC83_002837 [Bacillus iocasae]|uniref:Uncharacterized protein n=1 Tax=Priestia iocasae TaxID=2291674 RepID=A0ABS2QYD1_9BACI|nr:hypothetical protein [Metabacillus iocasae]